MTRGFLGVLGVLLLASQASAAPIAIGALYWTESDTEGYFSIVNLTGANYLEDPAFPVTDQLSFVGLNLDVLDVNGTTSIGQAALVDPGDGISYDTAAISLIPYPLSATLTGFVSPLLNVLIDLDGFGPGVATLWNILGLGAITDIDGNPVVLGDGINNIDPGLLAILYVDAEPVGPSVPEPVTFSLFGLGVAGLLVRRRLAGRQ